MLENVHCCAGPVGSVAGPSAIVAESKSQLCTDS